MKNIFTTLCLGAAATGVAQAQLPALTGTNIVTHVYQNRSLHATTSIVLQPGFVVSRNGFVARIVPAGNVGGSWTEPLAWNLPSGEAIVGIHTHVLPTGKVLSWEGHNDNLHWEPADRMTHALTWDPVSGLFEHFDNKTSNVFCSGHAFLPDGRLLVGTTPTTFQMTLTSPPR